MSYVFDITISDKTYSNSVLVLFLFVIILFGINQVATYFQIKNNWSRMRCRPEVMMSAWLYGIDADSNMEYCLENAGKQMKQGNIVDPVVSEMADTKNTLNDKLANANAKLNELNDKINNAELYKNNHNDNLAVALQNNILAIKEGMQKIIASLIIQRHMNNGVFKMTSGSKTLTDSLKKAVEQTVTK